VRQVRTEGQQPSRKVGKRRNFLPVPSSSPIA
jgi:hypothetical protein